MESKSTALLFIIGMLSALLENSVFSYATSDPSWGYALDVYTQHPTPHGGQGINMSSRGFTPRAEVVLYANVTYHLWPVQYKDVIFVVQYPEDSMRVILMNKTNENGIASVKFRVPQWNITSIKVIGIWNITAYINVYGVLIMDRLLFQIPYTDLNLDGKVDINDVVIVARAYASYPGHPRWKVIADLNRDDIVDLRDILLVVHDLWRIFE